MIINLIDADSIIYKVCYANKDSDNFLDYKNALDNWIEQILNDTKSTHYLGFLTLHSTFRHKIATNRAYKSGRPIYKPKFFYDLRLYAIEKWKLIYHEGVEAEDLIACEVRYKGVQCIISGIDHDLHQIRGIHYNYVTRETITITSEEAKWNFWKSMITGCTTDKIQGIPKMGDIKATKLLTKDEVKLSSEICRNLVLGEYLRYYGNSGGIKMFSETFRLLYLLRSTEEIWLECDLAYIAHDPIPYIKEAEPQDL